MKFTSALSTVLVLLPAVVHAIAIPAPVDATEIQRRGDDVVGRIVARQNRNNRFGQNRGQNRNGRNRNQNAANQNAANQNAANQNAANQNAANQNAANQNAANQNAANQNAANQNAANQNAANQNAANQAAANQTAVDPAAVDQAAVDQAAVDQAAADQAAAANQNAANNEDPQESLTLLAELVAPGLAQDGQDPPVAGQVASLTSTNNFINFCIGQTITNGAQVKEGSCNPVPMGDVIAQANMPSSKFTNPINFSTIPANQQFTASIAVQNMDTGFFTNAQKNYFAAPQQLNGQGILVAHSHIVIQQIQSLESTQVIDPINFAFFKGLNAPAVGGVLSADVSTGLPAGVYRMASIHTSANHAPAVGAVAQHGFFDDIVYFTAV